MKTKKLTQAAILAALSVVLLLLAAIVPSGRLTLIAIASLLPAAAIVESGLPWGAAVYVLTGLISVLLVPQKGVAIVYCLVLGHYALVKSLIERIGRLWLEWVCKIAWFTLVLSVLYAAFSSLLVLPDWLSGVAYPLLLVLGDAVYALYDLAYTQLIAFYLRRIRRKQ